jgi:hypothetical protein
MLLLVPLYKGLAAKQAGVYSLFMARSFALWAGYSAAFCVSESKEFHS